MLSIVPTANAAGTVDVLGNPIMVKVIDNIINPIILLMFAIATVVFIYGVLQMVIKGNDPEARSTGQKSILYGLIGMFIMVSAWGIVYFIARTVNGF